MLMTPKSSWQLQGDFKTNGIIVFENIEPLKEIVKYIQTVDGDDETPKQTIERLIRVINFDASPEEEGLDSEHLETLIAALEESLPFDIDNDFMPGTTVLLYPLDCSGTLAVTYFFEEV